MPPEPLPWDRKDFFKERKHERPEPHHHHHHHPIGGGGGGGYGGVGGFGGGPRWREPPHPHPHPYHYASPRWVSDFRYRPPPGYGKQGGRHLYSEESSHGFVPSRPAERMFDDESCRASGTGKYVRNNRDNRGPFGHKDLKGQSWEASPSPSGPGRPNGTVEQQRSVDDILTCTSSQPQLDSVNSWDQTPFKEQHEKGGGKNVSGSSGQRLERENSLGSIDWKPLKWTRSGSLSSRGSGFSHSSSSKSLGADSNEMKVELQPSNLSPVQSPSGDAVMTAAPCEVSAAASEETSARKKPRLGWGEGLAKYEKKKVEGVDDTVAKNGTLFYSSCREPVHVPHATHLGDKSPRINGFLDCASPATPSSVGCSSSPGLEEKQSAKPGHTDQATSNLSLSPGNVSQNHIEGSTFDLENLDLAQSGHLCSAINNLLQSDDLSAVDSGFVKSTAINKLVVWKGDVLKKLEMTECEIDRLEGELKSLIVVLESSFLYPATPSFLPVDSLSMPQELDATSNTMQRPAPLELVSPRDSDREKIPDVQEGEHAEVKSEDVDSPGSATSKFIEVSPLRKDSPPSGTEPDVERFLNTNMDKSTNLDLRSLGDCVHEERESEIAACSDASQLISSCATHANEFHLFGDRDRKICESILASNKESANRAAEEFDKLLGNGPCSFDKSNDSIICSSESNSLVKEKYLRRKRFLQFKERFVCLKFRALQYLWKEDVRLLSLRKFRVKSHKKLDLSLRTVYSSSQKQRSSIRSRLSSIDGNLSSVPNAELINFLSKLLSDSKIKPCRNTLKMPALILDRKEKMASRFISSNGLVEDPSAVEKERSMINPWTSEEKEIFMDKFTAYGKDFTKIASFLIHKSTADCIEFYYKNQKCDWFKKTKKHPSFSKQGKMHSANNYLVASGKRWNYEANAASLDILGVASAIAAKADSGTENQHKCSSKYMLGRSSDYKTSRGDNGLSERSSSLDVESNERETVAADVLAGICGSLSSEAMSSCITSAVDAGESYHEWKSHRVVGSLSRWPLTPEVTQNVDDETCSDESCGEMDYADWTDEEKSIFIQAVSSFGKDFTMISRCVSTRSRDQCKVFFSKARKCLGLDMICSGSGNLVRDDGNGGGSDADDACAVETGSAICSEKSGVKMEVELPSPETMLNTDEPDLAGIASAKPDLNQVDEINERGGLDSVETQLFSKNVVDGSQMDDKQSNEFDDDGEMRSCSSSEPVAVQEQGSVSIPTVEAVGGTCDQTYRSDAQDDSRPLDKLADHLGEESSGPLPLESIRNDVKEKSRASGLDPDLTSAVQVSKNSCNEASGNQSLVCGALSGNQKLAPLEFGTSVVSASAQNPCVPLHQKSFRVPMNLVPQVSVVKCGEVPNKATPSFTQVVKINGEQGHQAARAGQKFLSGSSFLGSFDSSQILINYPVPGSTIGEAEGESSFRRTVTFQSNPKVDKNIHQDQLARESFLQKCNGFKDQSSVAELPFRSLELVGDTNLSYRSSSSSDAEMPRRNGDVKLFGQILSKPSLQQKSGSGAQQNGDNENQPSGMGKPFSPRFSVDQAINGTISQTKLDRHNLLGSENRPLRRFWDGSRVQTGLNPLPDSAVLLARYPDAFGNYALPSSKMEQLPLNAMNSGERSLNGAAVFQAREIGSSNAVADYQAYRSRELQRQEVVLSEMQRRNGFDVVSGVQQQARGIVGINARRSILVGSQCTGVSDPVAAIKMHYSSANAEQLNGGHTGSMIREEDSWRGKGNVGR